MLTMTLCTPFWLLLLWVFRQFLNSILALSESLMRIFCHVRFRCSWLVLGFSDSFYDCYCLDCGGLRASTACKSFYGNRDVILMSTGLAVSLIVAISKTSSMSLGQVFWFDCDLSAKSRLFCYCGGCFDFNLPILFVPIYSPLMMIRPFVGCPFVPASILFNMRQGWPRLMILLRDFWYRPLRSRH